MNHDDALETLRKELARQDEAFEAGMAVLESVDADLELAIPRAFFEDLEAAAAPDNGASPVPAYALRA